jgi:hypothetical protein
LTTALDVLSIKKLSVMDTLNFLTYATRHLPDVLRLYADKEISKKLLKTL